MAFICQLYPKASPSTLLYKFFQMFEGWPWPKPVMLNQIQPNPPGTVKLRTVWSSDENPSHLMPIITPAYPAINSADKVNKHTLAVMAGEISRGKKLLRTLLIEKREVDIAWGQLFEPSDFYIKYQHYLQCHIIGTGDDVESRAWIGYVESRLLGLLTSLEYDRLPLQTPIHFYPEFSKTQKSAKSICYFIGFNVDREAAAKTDGHIHIDDCVFKFRYRLMDRYLGQKKEGLDFDVEHHTWNRLPPAVFENIGGRAAAKARRQQMFGTTKGKGATDIVADAPSLADPPPSTAAAVEATQSQSSGDVKMEGEGGDGAIVNDRSAVQMTGVSVTPDATAGDGTLVSVVGESEIETKKAIKRKNSDLDDAGTAQNIQVSTIEKKVKMGIKVSSLLPPPPAKSQSVRVAKCVWTFLKTQPG